jgi:hypothetical protein
MSIYISKNNQQAGPFADAQVLEMLRRGQISPNDLAIRHGETRWEPLGNIFPNVIPFISPPVSAISGGVKNTGGCRRVFGILLLVFGLLLCAGGLFFPVKGLVFGSGESYICRMAETYKQDAEQANREYERAKGTSFEEEKAQKLGQKIRIMESWGKTCSEMNENLRRWMIGLTILGVFGFFLAMIGFFIQRVRPLV